MKIQQTHTGKQGSEESKEAEKLRHKTINNLYKESPFEQFVK
ncbi:hypothetical protein B4077_3557 [Bacillus cereus]|uniref:Uncharacterized protein n=1 Tax=Bacillus cereus TaxID=1396 RepID=A0A0G8F169_BACCE|nr:hypothetical protein B4077_3557 [Bacillus cereus]